MLMLKTASILVVADAFGGFPKRMLGKTMLNMFAAALAGTAQA